MADFNLKARTFGNSSPKGKSKAYFCGTPNDMKVYFDVLSGEILDAQKELSIYYLDEECEYEDYLSDLEEMQLFIILLSSEFFTTKNRAMTEFEYACRHNIPTLLISVEKRIFEVPDFNRLVKSRQYLDRATVDPTGVPYKKKLSKFLEGVVVDSTLEERIRAEFAANVFISYRKKDRKHVKRIMELVHKDERFRDVGIWYDEFITPGEDYNSEISEALHKSDLFILQVTPNLLEEGNYVMKYEYPDACNSDKIILPIEAESTDRNALEGSYENIPKCLSEDAEILEYLDGFARKTNFKKSDDNPEHLYLIGLSYLLGIDMEVNAKRAITLITMAAEMDYPEAIRRLLISYVSGIGVERDISKVLYWADKYHTILEDAYREDPSAENYDALMANLMDLAFYSSETGNEDDIDKYDELFSIYAEQGEDPRLKYFAFALRNEFEATDKVFWDRMHQFEEEFEALPATSDNRGILGSIYNAFASKADSEGDVITAATYYQKSFEAITSELDKSDVTYKEQVILFLCNMAQLYLKLEENKSAADFYKDALRRLEKLDEEYNFVRNLKKFADIYMGLYEAEYDEENLMPARDHLLDALENAERYYEETKFPYVTQMCADINDQLADIYISQEKGKKAVSCLKEAISYTKLGIERNSSLNMSFITLYYQKLRQLLENINDWEGAFEVATEALSYANTISASNDSFDARIFLGNANTDLGMVYAHFDKYADSLRYLYTALKVYSELVSDYKSFDDEQNYESMELMSLCFMLIGSVHDSADEYDLALKNYKNGIYSYDSLYKSYDDPSVLVMIHNGYMAMHELAMRHGKNIFAKQYLSKADKYRRLYESFSDTEMSDGDEET